MVKVTGVAAAALHYGFSPLRGPKFAGQLRHLEFVVVILRHLHDLD
jgi:hypothetical protein